ncbi:MAG: ferredoxin--NADP reductase [Candidatus Eisenbacteria bacterium]|uniref:ferredoxin--NADP(+) reductase n=1 Tax=Eiseniibacteriota bacterium TaxID=2212470 RepID=A0A948RWR7_UNCEI|nr:ferredoxin--NADP reductase [Candidatus Eisenbacteria bacterium]MBU1947990.1 ferredoxin--NADP reductase [Candidatus Eisenbacteria bacterium]MBU2692280.1 ferredoxin--NADP reductase [Candidatus Eisenbacteria bacterium]
MATREINAVLSQKIEVAPGLIVIRVAPDGWELGPFKPGQYAVLGLPGSAPRCEGSDADEPELPPDKVIPRAYSIASSSRPGEYLEFYIALVRSGALTPRLFNLNIGDRLWLSEKMLGNFTLEKIPTDAHIVMVATGTGLAPYMSMVRTYLSENTGQQMAVIHGARHSWDLGYRSELEALQQISPFLTYIPIISRVADEPAPWKGASGYVQDVWTERLIKKYWGFSPKPNHTHVFLCGNPAMIAAMEKVLQADRFVENTKKQPGQYHVEKYW